MRDLVEWNAKQRERYRSRRIVYLEQMGGKCTKCGSVEDLEFDHIENVRRYSLTEKQRADIS